MENQIPLLCLEVGTDRVRTVLGARVGGDHFCLCLCGFSSLPSASWRGSQDLSHLSFSPCSFLFSLSPPSPPPHPPALSTMDLCLSLTVQGPEYMHTPAPHSEAGPAAWAEHCFTALVYSEQQVLGWGEAPENKINQLGTFSCPPGRRPNWRL